MNENLVSAAMKVQLLLGAHKTDGEREGIHFHTNEAVSSERYCPWGPKDYKAYNHPLKLMVCSTLSTNVHESRAFLLNRCSMAEVIFYNIL